MPFVGDTSRAKRISFVPRMMPYKILVKEIPQEEADKIEVIVQSQIAVPFRPTSNWGEVIAVGKGKWFGKKFIEPECKVGDIVAVNTNFDELMLKIGDSDDIYFIFDCGDVLLVYTK